MTAAWGFSSGGGGSQTLSVGFMNCGRLTPVSATPIITNFGAESGTIYWTPCPWIGDKVALFDGSNWAAYTLSELSASLAGFTKGQICDVFAYPSSGIPAIEVASWASQVTKTVTDATNAEPIVITTSAAHGLSTGNIVTIASVGGNTNANGTWRVTSTGASTFSLDHSKGNSAYTAGGTMVKRTYTRTNHTLVSAEGLYFKSTDASKLLIGTIGISSDGLTDMGSTPTRLLVNNIFNKAPTFFGELYINGSYGTAAQTRAAAGAATAVELIGVTDGGDETIEIDSPAVYTLNTTEAVFVQTLGAGEVLINWDGSITINNGTAADQLVFGNVKGRSRLGAGINIFDLSGQATTGAVAYANAGIYGTAWI